MELALHITGQATHPGLGTAAQAQAGNSNHSGSEVKVCIRNRACWLTQTPESGD